MKKKIERPLTKDEVLALIEKHLWWACHDYPRVDDAVYSLQQAVESAASSPAKESP